MKQFQFVALIILVGTMFVLVGCNQAEAPPPTEAPASDSASTDESEVVEDAEEASETAEEMEETSEMAEDAEETSETAEEMEEISEMAEDAEEASETSEVAEASEAEESSETSETVAEVAEQFEYDSGMLRFFEPLPESVPPTDYELTEELVDLGRMLYYEERLSINQQMSCNTCHLLDQFGAEPLATSLSHDGVSVGHRNAPTVYNAALHVAQFWDGRSPTVETQALGPVLAEVEMGMPDEAYVEEVLASIPGYEPLFQGAFPEDENAITFENMGIAIGAFERNLLTPSRFDDFLNGDETALNDEEKQGLATFVQVGCATCHLGAGLGGDLYHKMGLVEPYETEDLGRFEVTNNESDKHVFKVPSLRNIAETAPYLHDGSVETLEESIVIMGKYQLGRDLTDEQVNDIVLFLETLTGEIPMDYIARPELPESGPDTPTVPENTEN